METRAAVKSILITGSEGFIGKHLVSELNVIGGYIPVTLDIEQGAIFRVDIRNEDAMSTLINSSSIDACVHLAAIAAPDRCKKDPSLAWETNVRGTHNVLRLCERAKIPRVVFFSSAHVYGI